MTWQGSASAWSAVWRGNRVRRSSLRLFSRVRSSREADFLNYGHPAPVLVRRHGVVDFPQPPSYALPLGLGGLAGEGPKPYRVEFAPGEQLLLYTDGVTEARDESGFFYPPGERAYPLQDPEVQCALQTLREDLERHAAGPPHDDAGMLLLRYRAQAAGESVSLA